MSKPKILFLDVETWPIEASTWGLWDVNVGLNQIRKDWSLLSWAAKWQGGQMQYQDTSQRRNVRDDRALLKGIWKLLDEADIVIGQNSKAFDLKKLNARFAIQGMKPPSSYKQLDTKLLAKKHFGFTSNSLEYLAKALGCKYQKLTSRRYVGQDLWTACEKRVPAAWAEMQRYNKRDVLAMEEVYNKLVPWDAGVNPNLYSDKVQNRCKCGANDWKTRGFAFTNVGKYQRYQCRQCGTETRGRENLFTPDKRKSLRVG